MTGGRPAGYPFCSSRLLCMTFLRIIIIGATRTYTETGHILSAGALLQLDSASPEECTTVLTNQAEWRRAQGG